jgi:hypothetical protein
MTTDDRSPADQAISNAAAEIGMALRDQLVKIRGGNTETVFTLLINVGGDNEGHVHVISNLHPKDVGRMMSVALETWKERSDIAREMTPLGPSVPPKH